MVWVRPLLFLAAVGAAGCGHPTLHEVFHDDVDIAELSVAGPQVKIVVTRSGCATSRSELAFSDVEAATCVSSLKVGQTVVMIERQLRFPLMSIGKAPEVYQSLGPCKLPRSAFKSLNYVPCPAAAR